MALCAVGQLSGRKVKTGMAACRGFGIVFVAGVAAVLGIRGRMAGLAAHLAFAAVIQREGVSLERRGAPPARGVAVVAAGAEETGMQNGFFVAAVTMRGRAAELVVFVAIGALQTAVLTIQRKNDLVVKAVQPVYPIVAHQAVLTILLDMLGHKAAVVLVMAGDARGSRKRQ